MPTTSNFGWTTPADTDLVKDGAAAIRTLGNGIDTSLVDLKGGTTGQVLSKNSNTDLDYTWVTPNVGDITEVQAGTGISVASGTGPIPVVTNSMATEITAKGDLIVGTGSGTFDNLAVGTNGHTLVADSATATGLKWAAASSGGMTSLASGTLSGSVVNLTSISGSYKNLKLVIRNFRPSSENDYVFYIRVNADSTANRYGTSQWDVGSSGSFNDSYWYWTYANDNATSQSYIVVDIEDYANTSTWKVASGRSVTTDPGTNTWFRWGYRNLVYNQTGAITQLNIGVTTGTFNAGDYILYGVS